MIRLIASDIDGTLVRDGSHEINPQIYDVIAKLHACGVQIALASGRQWVSIERLFAPVKEKIFYISDNGAYVGCHGRQLFLNYFDRDLAMEMVEDIRRQPGLEYMVSGPDAVYLDTKDRDFLDLLTYGYRFAMEKMDDVTEMTEPVIKMAIYCGAGGIEKKTEQLRGRYADRLHVMVSGDKWVDFVMPGVSKGWGIERLQKDLGISPEETMAFGDQQNDVDMLKKAYYSFAVGNAVPEAKAAARFAAAANVDDGVLKILKLLV